MVEFETEEDPSGKTKGDETGDGEREKQGKTEPLVDDSGASARSGDSGLVSLDRGLLPGGRDCAAGHEIRRDPD